MTALLDNWKIALSFVAVWRTFEPAHLMNLSVRLTVGDAKPGGWSRTDEFQSAHLVSGVDSTRGDTACDVPCSSPSARDFQHTSPAGALDVPVAAPPAWRGTRDVLSRMPGAHPAGKPQEPQRDKLHLSGPVGFGI